VIDPFRWYDKDQKPGCPGELFVDEYIASLHLRRTAYLAYAGSTETLGTCLAACTRHSLHGGPRSRTSIRHKDRNWVLYLIRDYVRWYVGFLSKSGPALFPKSDISFSHAIVRISGSRSGCRGLCRWVTLVSLEMQWRRRRL
jgi:hypothetical protein